jgi:hypothetical protein
VLLPTLLLLMYCPHPHAPLRILKLRITTHRVKERMHVSFSDPASGHFGTSPWKE